MNVPLTPEQQRLVEQHLPLAERMAGKMAMRLPVHARGDQLLSDASLGLIRAARRYNPARHVAFGTYAGQRIWGEMLDGLRDRDTKKRWMKATRARMVPLCRARQTADEHLPHDYIEQQRAAIGEITQGLSEHERAVVERKYVDEMPGSQIGRELGVSESQVSLLHTRAITKLMQRNEP